MFEIRDLTYRYHKVMFRFNAEFSQSSITAVMGPSGAGKSTLLALIAGFITPERGEVCLNGQSVLGLEPYQRPFAMLFQEHNLFSHLTVRENIGLGLHPGLKLSSAQRQQVETAAEQVGLLEYLDRLPEQLSGGQKQRIALARCFVQPHSVWLLDEPFSALDPILRVEMLQLVKRLAEEREITVLMVTHHVSDAKSIATDFVYIDDNQVMVSDVIGNLKPEHDNTRLSAFIRAAE